MTLPEPQFLGQTLAFVAIIGTHWKPQYLHQLHISEDPNFGSALIWRSVDAPPAVSMNGAERKLRLPVVLQTIDRSGYTTISLGSSQRMADLADQKIRQELEQKMVSKK